MKKKKNNNTIKINNWSIKRKWQETRSIFKKENCKRLREAHPAGLPYGQERVVCVCTFIYIYIYIYIYIHIHICIYIYIHIIIYIYIYTHMYLYSGLFVLLLLLCVYVCCLCFCCMPSSPVGWRYLSEATCLTRPRLVYVLFVVSIRGNWSTGFLDYILPWTPQL